MEETDGKLVKTKWAEVTRMGEKEFVDSIAWLAQENSRKSGILASIIIAQACLESGYGTSKLATFANNLFGMKCMLSGNTWESVWDGKSKYQKVTMEQKPSGEAYCIRCDFRKYPDTESCIKDHSAYLLNAMNGAQRRFGMVGAKDYRLVASEIQKGGYATDVRYADKICEIIEKWNLTKYDGGKTVKICLDAGHYGKYNQSPVDDRYYESDMVWKLHLLQKKYLEEYGAEVIITRGSQGTNMGLYERGVLSFGCDLFVSSHSNATEKESVDYPVSYCSIDGRADGIGRLLAECVERVMGTSQQARIEHRRGQRGDYYGVLRGATEVGVPGLILEHSFHTNLAATQWLLNDDNLDRLAREEAKTIAKYYGLKMEKKSGWVHEDGGERFYLGDSGKYVKNDWYQDDGKWYWFDGAGHMVEDTWYQYKGEWYYLGQDGAMVKGLQSVDGKWYYLDQGGKMSKEPVLLTPGEDGALRYPEMVTE